MVDISFDGAEICVVGRSDFNSGIGAVGFAACELLSRYFPVSFYSTNPVIDAEHITLPNGRLVPVCKDLQTAKVFFYTDVLWNGEYDRNYMKLPAHGLRIAHIAYDSDQFPAKWVEILNNHFDVAYFSSGHLEAVARTSGIKIPIGTLPIGLDTELLLANPFTENQDKVRFGSVAAYHPRKGMDILVEAFIAEFGASTDVELVLHSNIAMGSVYQNVQRAVQKGATNNITLSNANLDFAEKNALIESFDVFVNCSRGEGYSIGPREALAMGKVLVLSDIGPHRDLFGLPGTFAIPVSIGFPARYPEIDNQIFGRQFSPSVQATRTALRQAYEYVRNPGLTSSADVRARKERASQFAFHSLALDYAHTIVPDIARFKVNSRQSSYTHIPAAADDAAIRAVGAYGAKLVARNRVVLPAHDGGFYSVFNAFMSHLTWDMQEDRCHMVLPDWDVGRLVAHQGDKKLVSFCYGRPQDGNIWLKLFKPLYGLSEQQMNDEKFLYEKSSTPPAIWNQNREPLLTYVHAFDLYGSPTFKSFRRQYHAAYKAHVHLLPQFQDEVDAFKDAHFDGKFIFAAHVKHPSHMIEQPGMCIAHGQAFIDAILGQLPARGLSMADQDWGVFLATDQDRVVAQFKEAFGDRVCCFDDVRRTRISEDELYDSLSADDKAKEGFQVQHLVAASPENWSTRMAWEVIRDATVMSQANVLFHVVSNVSTAVSYMNPDVELIFIQ
jgi:glycosyltransferase involved in cell wall biosynthesis